MYKHLYKPNDISIKYSKEMISIPIHPFMKEQEINYNRQDILVMRQALTTLIILFWPIMSTGSLLKNWMGVSTFYIIGICLSFIRIKQHI